MNPWLGLGLLLLAAFAVFVVWGGFVIAWDAMHPPRKGFAWALGTGRAGSPEALDLKFEETRLPGVDGASCPAWRVECGGGPEAPVLLMLHGWGRSRWDSLARLRPLLPLVREAWLPDLPAHGEHRGRRCWVGVREAEAVTAMAADIAAKRPHARLLLMGHSLGAGLAIRAARSPELPVAGVIALAPYRDLRSPVPGRMALHGLPRRPFTSIGFALLRAAGCMDTPLEHDASGVRAPALVVACAEDRIAPAHDAETIAAAMPHATLLVLPGDRHDEPGAGDPERFESTLRAFVASLSPASRA